MVRYIGISALEAGTASASYTIFVHMEYPSRNSTSTSRFDFDFDFYTSTSTFTLRLRLLHFDFEFRFERLSAATSWSVRDSLFNDLP